MADGKEGLRGLGEHPNATVANTGMNTIAMVRRSLINTFVRLLIAVVWSAEMAESVAATQAEAARMASPELLLRASLHPSGIF